MASGPRQAPPPPSGMGPGLRFQADKPRLPPSSVGWSLQPTPTARSSLPRRPPLWVLHIRSAYTCPGSSQKAGQAGQPGTVMLCFLRALSFPCGSRVLCAALAVPAGAPHHSLHRLLLPACACRLPPGSRSRAPGCRPVRAPPPQRAAPRADQRQPWERGHECVLVPSHTSRCLPRVPAAPDPSLLCPRCPRPARGDCSVARQEGLRPPPPLSHPARCLPEHHLNL